MPSALEALVLPSTAENRHVRKSNPVVALTLLDTRYVRRQLQ